MDMIIIIIDNIIFFNIYFKNNIRFDYRYIRYIDIFIIMIIVILRIHFKIIIIIIRFKI